MAFLPTSPESSSRMSSALGMSSTEFTALRPGEGCAEPLRAAASLSSFWYRLSGRPSLPGPGPAAGDGAGRCTCGCAVAGAADDEAGAGAVWTDAVGAGVVWACLVCAGDDPVPAQFVAAHSLSDRLPDEYTSAGGSACSQALLSGPPAYGSSGGSCCQSSGSGPGSAAAVPRPPRAGNREEDECCWLERCCPEPGWPEPCCAEPCCAEPCWGLCPRRRFSAAAAAGPEATAEEPWARCG